MNHHLPTLFNKLTDYLIAANSPLPHLFQSPIDRQTVNTLVAGLGFILPEEVYSLYNWHNGTKETDDEYTYGQLWLFPLGIFVPVERSVEAYKHYAGKDGYWQNAMFMLFEGGGGEMFLIDCDADSDTYRRILKHDYGDVDHGIATPAFDSLEAVFVSIVECLEKRAFFHDANGGLKADPKLYFPIMKRNNPNSDLWDVPAWEK